MTKYRIQMLEMDSDYILACRGNTEIEYETQPHPETYCISITININKRSKFQNYKIFFD